MILLKRTRGFQLGEALLDSNKYAKHTAEKNPWPLVWVTDTQTKHKPLSLSFPHYLVEHSHKQYKNRTLDYLEWQSLRHCIIVRNVPKIGKPPVPIWHAPVACP